jgi:hypothetical protein
MEPFNIPCKFLDLDPKPTKPPIQQPKPEKTFAQAVSNICEIPISQLPQGVIKGDCLAIQNPYTNYTTKMEACKYNLHGRFIWQKGSPPFTMVALKAKLSQF